MNKEYKINSYYTDSNKTLEDILYQYFSFYIKQQLDDVEYFCG